MKHILYYAALLFGATLLPGQSLLDFETFPSPQIRGNGADVRKSATHSGTLEVKVKRNNAWPGVNFAAPENAAWDFKGAGAVELDIENTSDVPLPLEIQIDNDGADGNRNCVKGGFLFNPGEKRPIRIVFPHRNAGTPDPEIKLFGLKNPPPGLVGPRNLDPARIIRAKLFVYNPQRDYTFRVSGLRTVEGGPLSAPATQNAAEFFPFVDRYGQYRHSDWPEKIHTDSDLADAAKAEEADLAAHPGPAGWNRFGGWADGPSLRATGYFRTEKYQNNWYLVDPEGKLFFSTGVTCVTPDAGSGGTALDSRRNYYEWLPEKNSEYAPCFNRHLNPAIGFYRQEKILPETFDFRQANLIRKHGADYREHFADLTHRRLRSWGFNTLGNWSDNQIAQGKRTPYTLNLSFRSPMLEGHKTNEWTRFREVFAPEFPQAVQTALSERFPWSVNDPWCIGYFVDNEIQWGNTTAMSRAVIASGPRQPSKLKMVEFLKQRYDSIAELNRCWETAFADWDAFLTNRNPVESKGAIPDLRQFNRLLIEQYFKTVRDALREAVPNQLYLGCRFNGYDGFNADVDAAASRYCDVVSYNVYQYSPEFYRTPSNADVPLLIGEYHFGTWDRGTANPGLKPVAGQVERAASLVRYQEGALRNPRIVGCHYFQFADQPLTGRSFDGENFQIGLVDIADTPYPELIEANRKFAEALYQFRLPVASRR